VACAATARFVPGLSKDVVPQTAGRRRSRGRSAGLDWPVESHSGSEVPGPARPAYSERGKESGRPKRELGCEPGHEKAAVPKPKTPDVELGV